MVLAGTLAVAVTLRRLERFEVLGNSMHPALEHGDRVLVVRGARPRPGDVVAVRDPRAPERRMLKRVAAGPGQTAVAPGGRVLVAGTGYVVLGDNPTASTDSTHFGPVENSHITGRAVYRYEPPGRRGRLRSRRVRHP